LQRIVNQLPDAFIDTRKIIKSNIPTKNTPAQIDILKEQLDSTLKTRLKCERPAM